MPAIASNKRRRSASPEEEESRPAKTNRATEDTTTTKQSEDEKEGPVENESSTETRVTEENTAKPEIDNETKMESEPCAESNNNNGPEATENAVEVAENDSQSELNKLIPYQPYLNIDKNLFTFELSERPDPSKTPLSCLIFGTGDMGQFGLGDDDTDEIPKPKLHPWFETKIKEGALGNGHGVADLEVGGMHTLTVGADGVIYTWGANDNAALGRITEKEGEESDVLESQPLPVEGLDVKDFKAVKVAAGDSVSLAISDKGELRAWGSFRCSQGALGFSKIENSDSNGDENINLRQFTPVKLPNIDDKVYSVACGSDHVLVLTVKGAVYTFGNGENYELGHKLDKKEDGLNPQKLEELKDIKVVGAGSFHSFAVDKDGKVYAWGLNSFHQTGISENDGGDKELIEKPTLVENLDPKYHNGAHVIAISAGEQHSLFLFSNGQVYSCGRCDGFEVGLPSDNEEIVAANERKKVAEHKRDQVRQAKEEELAQEGQEGEGEKKISHEEISNKAAEYAAESVHLPNDYVPNPTKLPFNNPQEKGDDVKIVQIVAGSRHNLAVDKDGNVYGWGLNESSQIGLGSATEEQEVPKLIISKALENIKVLKATTSGQYSLLMGYKSESQQQEQEPKQNQVPEQGQDQEPKEELTKN